MFWKPNTFASPQASTVTVLKSSRVSDHSTEIDRSFKINQSFELDSSNPNTNLSFIATFTTPSRGLSLNKNGDRLISERIKREYLTKVLMNRMINVRLAVKTMEGLPIKIFKKTASFIMAKEILMKCKINAETSVLRTLIFAEAQRSENTCKFSISRGRDVFVLPTPSENDDSFAKRQALMKLKALMTVHVRNAVKAIRQNWQNTNTVMRYFSKLCANYQYSRESAFTKIKALPGRGAAKSIAIKLRDKQLKISWKIIETKYSAIMLHSLHLLASHSQMESYKYQVAARQILACSKFRQQQCIKDWLAYARAKKHQQQEQIRVNGEKLCALTRIVQRNYLKLYLEINRRLYNFRLVARRIACGSKINEQKSLWRLLVHLKRQKYIE